MDESEFEQFWNRNETLLLKFCELLETDKEGFKINVYDQFKTYGIISALEEKLPKIYKKTKAMKYLYGNKTIELQKFRITGNISTINLLRKYEKRQRIYERLENREKS